MAAQLGSDVPFFVTGGTALVEGRGERVSNVKTPPTLWLVLAFPDHRLENKTATAYRALTPSHYTDGRRTADLVKRIEADSEIGHDSFFNVFDRVAAQIFPASTGHGRFCRRHPASRSFFRERAQLCFVVSTALRKVKESSLNVRRGGWTPAWSGPWPRVKGP